jgi:YegS/Rv2252/BmrU family lipid kinase
VIVNPAAGRGAARKLGSQIGASFAGASIVETSQEGDEELLARDAIQRGARLLVSVGGDGTCGRIASEIIKSGKNCSLAIVPSGTGNDFAKTLGVTGYTPERVRNLIDRAAPVEIDVGLADEQYFINSCGFGFDASVLQTTKRVRFLRGDAVYLYAAGRQLFRYRGAEVSAAGAPVKRGQMLMVTVSNGRFLGGAFKIAPRASVLDGKLDACFVSDSNVIERVRLFLAAMRGTHIGMRSVTAVSVQRLTLTFPDQPWMEMDGELRRAQSKTVTLECVPRALSVIAAPGAIV